MALVEKGLLTSTKWFHGHLPSHPYLRLFLRAGIVVPSSKSRAEIGVSLHHATATGRCDGSFWEECHESMGVYELGVSGGVLKWGYPSNHPFIDGIFHYHPAMVVPPCMETPTRCSHVHLRKITASHKHVD